MPPPEALRGIPSVPTLGSAGSVLPTSHAILDGSVPSGSGPPLAVTPQGNSSVLCNLLPRLGQASESSLTAGIYVGEGLLPVPAKLAEKITRWEFVDMAELLPECWSSFGPKESVSAPGTRFGGYRRRRAVTDIATWVQCFATYVSVMSTPHPQAVPELLAYLIFVLRASQDFGGIAWVTYDAAFRRQAFITGSRQWSKVNPSLYSICFSGVARTGQRCELCLSLSHPTRDCTMVNDPDPDVSARLKTLESAVLAFTSHPFPQQGLIPRARSPDICRNWNAGRCRMAQCRFRHVCRVCGGPNPAMTCCDRLLGPRSSSGPSDQSPSGSRRVGPGPSPADLPLSGNRRFGPGPPHVGYFPQGPERMGRARPGPLPY